MTPLPRPVRFGYTVTEMTAAKLKAALTLVGTALVTASVYLPVPWQLVAATVGGLLGGSALIRRPGDERVAK